MRRWGGYVACMEMIRNAYKRLVGNSQGKHPLGTPRHKWEDNIKMDFWEIMMEDVHCTLLTQGTHYL
jgi:hypothetical protein